MKKPVLMRVTLTCERCGAETGFDMDKAKVQNFSPRNHGYHQVEESVLDFKEYPPMFVVHTTYPDNMKGVGEMLICTNCCEELGILLKNLVYNFNGKVKNFLENREVSK